METRVIPLGRRTGKFVRLRLPELPDWSGEVHVSAGADERVESLVVSVWSDPPGLARLDCVIEESRDGVSWAVRDPAAPPVRA